MLTKSTPEGARDYLVPSRVHDGQFFALPQSPQLFKQMLMVAGYDRYYQIVKCFRDEDLRADRQPEFTQVDIETSFLTETEITAMMEEMIRTIFKEVLSVELPNPFPRMTYAEAWPLRLRQARPARHPRTHRRHRRRRTWPSRSSAAPPPPAARGRDARAGRRQPVPRRDRRIHQVRRHLRRPRPGHIKVNDVTQVNETGLQSPIVKNLHETALRTILERTGAQSGDLIFFGADKTKVVNDALGALRIKLGHEKATSTARPGGTPVGRRLPDVRIRRGRQALDRLPPPFTSPKDEHMDLLDTDPGKCLAKAYDLALNGWEIGGGSVRIHRADVQEKVFSASTSARRSNRPSSASCSTPSSYGAPPHGGWPSASTASSP